MQYNSGQIEIYSGFIKQCFFPDFACGCFYRWDVYGRHTFFTPCMSNYIFLYVLLSNTYFRNPSLFSCLSPRTHAHTPAVCTVCQSSDIPQDCVYSGLDCTTLQPLYLDLGISAASIVQPCGMNVIVWLAVLMQWSLLSVILTGLAAVNFRYFWQ